MARRHLQHRSTRWQQGYLCDISIERLMMMCREQRASGTLLVESWGRSARISWQGGEIIDAIAGTSSGGAALDEVRTMRDGRFTLRTSEPISLHATTPKVPEPTANPGPATRMEARRPAPAPARCVARRPAPPPLPTRAPGLGPAARRPAATPLVPAPASNHSSPAWPGQHMPQPYVHAAPHQVQTGTLVPRLRLPSTALSVGIFCVTMLVSLMAVIQL